MNESTILGKEDSTRGNGGGGGGGGGHVPGNLRVYSGLQLLSSPTAMRGSSACTKETWICDVIVVGRSYNRKKKKLHQLFVALILSHL
jgi:hypothetical protein